MGSFALPADVANLWRPLTSEETTRATYLLGVASRKIRRDFPDVDARIEAGTVDLLDVRDIAASLAIQALVPAPVPGARQWSVTSGSESQQVSLQSGIASDPLSLMEFTEWMRAILEGSSAPSTPVPVHYMPAGGGVSCLFPHSPEVYPS